jgi:two-component system sensor histidine kinase QseC
LIRRTRLRPKSLRARLLLTVSLTTFLVWCVAGIASYDQALHEADELMDGQLAQSAKLLMRLVQNRSVDPAVEHSPLQLLDDTASHPYEQHLEYRVLDANGKLLLNSGHAPEMNLHSRSDDESTYADLNFAGQPWRSLSLRSPDRRYLVQIAHPIIDRDRVGLEVATQVAIPILLALPLLAVLVYFSVRRSLRPLEELAADVAARSPDNLETLSEPQTLREALPLVAALNRLLSRLRATLDNERRFTADAAHELRTPLAAVKIQAQVALASTDAADHQHALRQVLVGADRATRLVEQLLRLARLDPLARLPQSRELDLAELASGIVAEMQTLATGKQQQLTFIDPPAPVELEGDADLLGVALRNLVENAVRYTPQSGAIEVLAETDGKRPQLIVRDSGPGVDAEEAPRLLERFYRGQAVANTDNSNGSGLGLAIVQRIAELHGAHLEIENRTGGGLEVRLRWPART